MNRMGTRRALCALALVVAPLLPACGSSNGGAVSSSSTARGGGTVIFTGEITGTWTKGGAKSESDCGTAGALIHIVGPASGDEGNLKVTSDGSVLVDIEKYGDFTSTSGGTFHPNKGFDVNADVATARGKKAHVAGSLSC